VNSSFAPFRGVNLTARAVSSWILVTLAAVVRNVKVLIPFRYSTGADIPKVCDGDVGRGGGDGERGVGGKKFGRGDGNFRRGDGNNLRRNFAERHNERNENGK